MGARPGLLGLVIFVWFSASLQVTAQPTVGLFKSDTAALDGFTLFSPNMTTYLVDNCGKEIHTWQHTSRPGLTAYLLEDGSLLRAGAAGEGLGAGSGGLIEKYDWDGNLTWSYLVNDSMALQHHDIEPMPNGNVLIPVWEVKTIAEGVQAGANENRGYWSFMILELKPIGNDSANVVWEWRLWDHLIQDHDPSKNNFGVVADHPELLNINFAPPTNNGDWIHVNSIDYNADRDEILVSARHTNEIYIIDHSTTTEEARSHSGGLKGKGGDFLYRWGNPVAYKAGTSSDRKLFRQHDAQWIPDGYPDEGMISIFNNGSDRPEGSYSSIEVIDPPLDMTGNYSLTNGAAYGPTTASWQYFAPNPSDFFSQNMGGAHRLSNGNSLITESNSGRIFEIDLNGNTVWEYVNPTNNNGPIQQGSFGNINVFRATRYAIDYPAFDGRDLTPGMPIELNPIDYECPSIIISTRSFSQSRGIKILGNPVTEVLVLEVENHEKLYLKIFSVTGQQFGQDILSNGINEVNVSKLNPGIYVLEILNTAKNSRVQFRIIKY